MWLDIVPAGEIVAPVVGVLEVVLGLFSLVLSGPETLSLDGLLRQDETVIDLWSSDTDVVDVIEDESVMS